MFLNITEDEKGQPFEVFINLGKAGGAAMADAEAMGRLISLALRSGIPMREVHRQLRGIASDKVVGLGPNKVMSVPDAIGIVLENWWRNKEGVQQDLLASPKTTTSPTEPVTVAQTTGVASQQMQQFDVYNGGESFIQTCPDCSSQLEFAEGCVKCHVCGFSECG
jgi:ribonucleoside-diphosphate reductase alpha chain